MRKSQMSPKILASLLWSRLPPYLDRTRAPPLSFLHHTKGQAGLYQTILIKKDQMLHKPTTHTALMVSWLRILISSRSKNDGTLRDKHLDLIVWKTNNVLKMLVVVTIKALDAPFCAVDCQAGPRLDLLITFSMNSTNWLFRSKYLDLVICTNIWI